MASSFHNMKRLALTRQMALLASLSVYGAANCQQSIPITEIKTAVIDWQPCKSAPEWIASITQAPGTFCFSTDGHGSLHQMAQIRATRAATSKVRAALYAHLMPSLGEDVADKVVKDMIGHACLVEARYLPTHPAPGVKPLANPPRIGRGEYHTIGAAYLRWELPVTEVIAEVDPAIKGRVENLLLCNSTYWQQVRAQPKWVTNIPQVDGHYRFLITTKGSPARDVVKASTSNARKDIKNHLVANLAPAIGKEHATRTAEAALNRATLAQRATWSRWIEPADDDSSAEHHASAFVIWDIPLITIRESVPAELRDDAMLALSRIKASDK
jgi:hypothetical protein